MTKKLIPILLTAFLFVSCVSYDFEGFTDTTVLSWLPYKTGDIIKYSNSTDTISFNVNKDYITPKSKKTKGLLIMDPPYYPAIANYNTTKENNTGLSINEYCEQECYLSIRFVDNDSIVLPYDYLKDFKSDTLDTKLKIIFHDTYKTNDTEFTNVYEVKKDTVDNNIRIWRVLLSPNYGVILFNDRSSNKEWRLIKD